MMRFAVIVLLLAACTSTAELPLDTPFALKHGETRGPVTFVDFSDSRCPRNAVCVGYPRHGERLTVNG